MRVQLELHPEVPGRTLGGRLRHLTLSSIVFVERVSTIQAGREAQRKTSMKQTCEWLDDQTRSLECYLIIRTGTKAQRKTSMKQTCEWLDDQTRSLECYSTIRTGTKAQRKTSMKQTCEWLDDQIAP